MRIWKSLGVVVAIAALSFVFVPKAAAYLYGHQFDQRTILTFNGPVAVPDRVLDPGTYVFKVVLFEGTRDIIQITNKDENQVLGSYITVTKTRPQPTSRVVVSFKEMPAGSPATIDAWWYPGFTDGHQFIYQELPAVGVAKLENEPAPSMPEEATPSAPAEERSTIAMENAPATLEEPRAEEVPMSQPAAETLPKTASSLPLVGLIGLLSLAAAFSLLIVTRRVG